MSRSGYTDDCDDNWGLIRWRGQVASSIRGARGQALLRELLAALDAMPEKRLAADSLVTADGEYCALGALGAVRGIDLSTLDPEDPDAVAAAFGVAAPLVREIVYMNDDGAVCPYFFRGTIDQMAEVRWKRMRDWVASRIKQQG